MNTSNMTTSEADELTWTDTTEDFLGNVTWAPPFANKSSYINMLIALTVIFAILFVLVAAAAGYFIFTYRNKIKTLEGGQTERGQDAKSTGRPASGASSVTSGSVTKGGA